MICSPRRAVPAEFLESVVLTAADNSGDAAKTKIRIELNGEKSVIGQNNQKLWRTCSQAAAH
nr:hypothetical protein [Paenibacillus kribbensis]